MDGNGEGAKSYDGEKAWSSIINSYFLLSNILYSRALECLQCVPIKDKTNNNQNALQ